MALEVLARCSRFSLRFLWFSMASLAFLGYSLLPEAPGRTWAPLAFSGAPRRFWAFQGVPGRPWAVLMLMGAVFEVPCAPGAPRPVPDQF